MGVEPIDERVPARLIAMIDSGVWRTDGEIDARIEPALAKSWDPVASGVHLDAGLCTVAQTIAEITNLADLWPVDDVDASSLLSIGDLGLGSDHPLVLDLGHDPAPVMVIDFETRSGPGGQPRWRRVADDFDRFVEQLGLI